MLMDINCGHFVANHQRFKDFYKPCSLCANCIAGEMIQETLHFFTPLIHITANETPGTGSSL